MQSKIYKVKIVSVCFWCLSNDFSRNILLFFNREIKYLRVDKIILDFYLNKTPSLCDKHKTCISEIVNADSDWLHFHRKFFHFHRKKKSCCNVPKLKKKQKKNRNSLPGALSKKWIQTGCWLNSIR